MPCFRISRAFVIASLVASMGASVCGHRLRADEPVTDFLEELREAQYYDMALAYLSRIEKGEIAASEEVKNELLLERGETLQKAAVASRSAKERDQLLDQSEAALRKFIESQASSSRVDEARLQLATLQLVRGIQLSENPKLDDAGKKKGQALLSGAAGTYDEVVEKLRGKLKELQGQKAEDAEAIALRDTYRSQFLAAYLSAGVSRQHLADLYPKDSPERKKALEEAEKKFAELTENYSNRPQGALALHHRASVLEVMGKTDEALDLHIRMLELPDIDELRESQVKSLTQAIRIWLKKDPPQYKPAIDRGNGMLVKMAPAERGFAYWQALSLETAKAYLMQADALQKENAGASKISAAKKEARRLLVAAAKVAGDHQQEATKLLSGLGVDTESAAPPTVTVKTFPDALSRGRELLEALESQLLPLRLIEEQLEKEPNNETVKQQQKKLIDEMDAQRQEAIDVLSTAPRLVDEETTIDDVNQSRFYLAYALLTAERYRESAVVANFLCRKYPTNALAPQAGGLAVRAYQGLLAAAQKEPPPAIVSALDELARYMVERWPEDAASKTASEILVRVSLNQGRWRDADQYLEKIPAGSEERFTLQQLIGQLQWNEYLKLTEAKDTAGAAVLLDQAIVSLSKGLEKLPKEQVKGNTLLSGLLLAKAKLRKDQPKEALAVLENANYGPLVRLEGDNPVAPSDANLPSEVYRTTLQVLVSLATAQGGESNMLDRAAAIIEKLRKAVEGQPNAEQKLVGIYYSLAKDIRQQLDDAQPARRGQLVDAFNLLLEKLIPLTNDNSTLRWIGQTFSELGQTLQPNLEAPAKGQSEKLYKNAVDAFAKALANQPGDSETQLRFEQAKVLRHLGRYKESIDEFEKVLLAKNMMVDAQIEAALTFQIWAASDTYKLYDAAMLGGRKNNKNGRNTIWGWGKISQTTNGRKELEAQFFEARYRLAECRFLSGKSHPDAARGKLLVEQSLKDIVSVIVAFPEVGGPATKARFDALAKKIQTQLGQPPAGLSALSEAPPSS